MKQADQFKVILCLSHFLADLGYMKLCLKTKRASKMAYWAKTLVLWACCPEFHFCDLG